MRQNSAFIELTEQRAIGYWSCYYRDKCSRGAYPALVALDRLREGASASPRGLGFRLVAALAPGTPEVVRVPQRDCKARRAILNAMAHGKPEPSLSSE